MFMRLNSKKWCVLFNRSYRLGVTTEKISGFGASWDLFDQVGWLCSLLCPWWVPIRQLWRGFQFWRIEVSVSNQQIEEQQQAKSAANKKGPKGYLKIYAGIVSRPHSSANRQQTRQSLSSHPTLALSKLPKTIESAAFKASLKEYLKMDDAASVMSTVSTSTKFPQGGELILSSSLHSIVWSHLVYCCTHRFQQI